MKLPNARPYAFEFIPSSTALLIVDMQRDFLDPAGFGSIQCGDSSIFSRVRDIVPIVQQVLEVSRSLGLCIIHTREGHEPGLSDLSAAKRLRQISAPHGHHKSGIGDKGPMGRLLVRGEYGHDIVDELKPLPNELVIDKPGKGSFWETTLHRQLLARGITHLIVTGVTTECCVTTTVRECNDRGFECCILSDCTDGFDQQMVTTSLDIICGQDGLFGYVGHSSDLFAQASASEMLFTPPSTPPLDPEGLLLSIASLRRLYKNMLSSPQKIVGLVYDRIEKYEKEDPAVWISRRSKDEAIEAAKSLEAEYMGKPLPPLYGVPFAVKDSIDVEGVITTAACEKYAYLAKSTAVSVQLLLDAGALYVGKVNLDQLATGLSGCRSPYGTCHSVYSKDHISGGSSSGSAVVVGAGIVPFAVATDTAGSTRVPAAFNGIVGYKPTKGTISARGLVPACKSLDTITVMATTVSDIRELWYVLDKYDDQDPYAKLPNSLPTWITDFRGPKEGGFTFGVPPQSALSMCTPAYQTLYFEAIQMLKTCGGTSKEIDWSPFEGAANLLYDATLVHERVACLDPIFLSENLDSLHPVTKTIFESAFNAPVKAWQVFRDQDLQRRYTRSAQRVFAEVDVVVVPSTTCHPTIAAMEKDPLGLNAKLGYFTHSGNVLDLCAVGINAGWDHSLPFGITFLGGSGTDGKVFGIAAAFEQAFSKPSAKA